MMSASRHSERGAALLTVLMIIAAMAVAALAVSSAITQSTQRARSLDAQAQLGAARQLQARHQETAAGEAEFGQREGLVLALDPRRQTQLVQVFSRAWVDRKHHGHVGRDGLDRLSPRSLCDRLPLVYALRDPGDPCRLHLGGPAFTSGSIVRPPDSP